MTTCACGGRTGDAPPVADPTGAAAPRPRAGTHATFLAAMLDRLSAADLPGLAGLTTRDPADPAIALCDAWAAAADVLTFYQERIVREGYLRTATEPRSLHELTTLIGHRPRPGTAADTHLAFRLEDGHTESIPAGLRVQSMPGPGELPQPYETGEPLRAFAAANTLPIRTTRPQPVTHDTAGELPALWLDGTATRLRANDLLLIRVDEGGSVSHTPRRVAAIEEDAERHRTLVRLDGGQQPVPDPWPRVDGLDDLVALLTADPGAAPSGPAAGATDAELRLRELLDPALAGVLHSAWAAATVSGPPAVEVHALRVAAPLFGYNAPLMPTFEEGTPLPMDEWQDWDSEGPHGPELRPETDHAVHLDNAYPDIRGGSLAVVVRGAAANEDGTPADAPVLAVLGAVPGAPFTVDLVSRSAYGLTARSTRITLAGETWPVPTSMDELRRTTVHAAPEVLPLAELPITELVQGAVLELAGLVEGLEAGRLLVVSGERAGLPGVAGVGVAEAARIAEVRQGTADPGEDGPPPGESNHSFVVLERPLTHRYVRDTVTVHGNVVRATHGETRTEVLGSGDAAVPGQRFVLRSGPLTHVSAATSAGVRSTLEVTVDSVRWPERPWLLGLAPGERGYTTATDEHGATAVLFPDGVSGRRPASGSENIRARYRVGTGRAGNADAGRITVLVDKPLGVREVVNPLPGTGGTDPESPDRARDDAPLPLRTLDRLVSLADYADFARTFGGVGKASADRLPDGRGTVIAVTVTGADGAPLLPDSAVVAALRRALRDLGDPAVRIRVMPARRLVLRIAARIGLLPGHDWAPVEEAVRRALLGAFGPARRELAQRVVPSEVVSAVRSVAGVRTCRGVTLASEPPGTPAPPGQHPGPWLPALGTRRGPDGRLLPAQLLCTADELPECLVLTRIEEDTV
ncbi:putative baseplate assembly protein [Streptomyces hirsutus]|uniref:putative baseplate assembly protein n=1 Tax=Streptomyces hirsutus TaxID=35620 RepID=UPI0038693D3E|nr:putative baseplate assembly protein [Streptomyces hirsutus]